MKHVPSKGQGDGARASEMRRLGKRRVPGPSPSIKERVARVRQAKEARRA